ncbi:FkbM family methyltransferase [Thermodesulfobacteriota bacterium]
MHPTNSIISRILKSLREKTFFVKLHNRISRTKYVPSLETNLDQFLSEYYPGEAWKHFSTTAKQIWTDLSPLFAELKIQNIAYVGAHLGEIALAMDEAFPGLHFYLLEPVPATYQKLMTNISSRSNMECFNLAAGAKEEELEIFADNFSPASSFLPYEEKALQEFPFLGLGRAVKVRVKPLDQVLDERGDEKIDLLIMDVQGYEDRVLQGASMAVKNCKAVISELTLQGIYAGGSTFDSVYRTLFSEGFRLQQFMNPIAGVSQRILQIDGVFIRN